MTSIRNDLIQSAIVTYLKSKTEVLVELSDQKEIREDQWQGINFVYPCIRVNIISTVPVDANCNSANIRLSILAYSEESSSFQADRIAGIIMSVLHAKGFSQNGYMLNLRCTDLRGAQRTEKAWQSEVVIAGTVNG